MPLDAGLWFSAVQFAIEVAKSARFRSNVAERQELRNALRALHFSNETLDRLSLPADNNSRDFLAIKLRDTNRDVSKALDLLKDFSNLDRVSIELQQAIDFIRWNKIDIRKAIQQELLGKTNLNLLEKIRELNKTIVEVDEQIGGPIL
jgi:hypothetical protein